MEVKWRNDWLRMVERLDGDIGLERATRSTELPIRAQRKRGRGMCPPPSLSRHAAIIRLNKTQGVVHATIYLREVSPQGLLPLQFLADIAHHVDLPYLASVTKPGLAGA